MAISHQIFLQFQRNWFFVFFVFFLFLFFVVVVLYTFIILFSHLFGKICEHLPGLVACKCLKTTVARQGKNRDCSFSMRQYVRV